MRPNQMQTECHAVQCNNRKRSNTARSQTEPDNMAQGPVVRSRLGRACGYLAAFVLLQGIAGCAVGPDFVRPQPPAVTRFTAQPLKGVDETLDVPRRWWTLFGSPELDALVDGALKAHPNIDSAEAALRAARETRIAQQGAFFPSVQAGLNPTRQKASATLSPPLASNASIYNLTTGQVSVGYTPDLFGANRRAVESLVSQEEAQAVQLEATRQSLAANLVGAAIQEAALRAQIDATQAAVGTATEQLTLARRQLALGAIPEAGIIAQEAALAQVQAALPVLHKQLAVQRDLIAQLSGRLPADMPKETLDFSKLSMPDRLPSSLPSALVEHRPDIRMAQAQWHAANAQIGVATAAMLPQLNLTGAYGGAGGLTSLLSATSLFWQIGAGLTQPLFQGGTLLHRKRAAQAQADSAAAQYRATVLSAFQNVADSLQSLDADREAVGDANQAESAARRSLDVSRTQVKFGDASYLSMLNAQQTWQQATATRIQAQANQLGDVVALCLSLGGGWWRDAS